jgi:hypothetical protein
MKCCGGNPGGVKLKHVEKNLPQWLFVNHKFHVNWPVIVPGSS